MITQSVFLGTRQIRKKFPWRTYQEKRDSSTRRSSQERRDSEEEAARKSLHSTQAETKSLLHESYDAE